MLRIRLIHSILLSSPNLISLDLQKTDIALDESLINAINDHPVLDHLMLENIGQLGTLPVELCSRTSFARIHVLGLRLDGGHRILPAGILDALFHRPPKSSFPGPHLSELQVVFFPSSAWTGLTFNSLRKLTIPNVDDAFATGGCGGFFDRHTGLEEIYLNGDGLRREIALKSIPCLRELYEKAVKKGKGMEQCFQVDSVSLWRAGGSHSHALSSLDTTVPGDEPSARDTTNIGEAPDWILKNISFIIVKDAPRTLTFVLENLPPCEDLYFQRRPEDEGLFDPDTSITQVGTLSSVVLTVMSGMIDLCRSLYSQSVLWDTILSSTDNLAHLISFGYSTFPLSDTLPAPNDNDNDNDEDEDEDDEADDNNDDELFEAMETLEPFVERLARKCPQLMQVSIAGLRGYAVADNYLSFHVDRREKEEDDGDSEQEIVIESDIRMYK